MAAGLIISIISVFIVISISAAIYIQNRKQGTSYDNKLTEVVSKTNNANQYEYEKNKDQEVSLDKLRNDIQTYDKRMNSIQNDFNYIKTQQAAQVSGMQKTLGDFKSSVETTNTAINRVDGEQTSRINGISSTLDGAMGQIKGINDKVTVINGQLVNIGQKQQSQIDVLSKDASAIKTEQGQLRDTIFNIKNENVARLQEQSKVMNDFTNNSAARLNTQDASIKTVTDKANSIENIVGSLNGTLSTLKDSLNNYITKTELSGSYASKSDLSSVDNKFGNYLTKTDFNTFKTNLPDFPTRTEMQGLVNNFITKQDISNINTTISDAQKALTDLSGIMSTVKTTYATKDDLMKITGDNSSGTVNIASLSITLQGIQDGLKALRADLTTTTNNLTTYKTDATNTFASKTELANLNTSLITQINAIKSGTSTILDTLTVNKNFVANGDAIINGTRFSKGWTGYPDNATDRSEISNDISSAKKLMIVGNKSAGAERRVGVWDKLDVHGNLGVDEWADAKNINAREHVRTGGDAWKTWMRYTGDMYASNKLGVGISPDHEWYGGNNKQAIFNGGSAVDWQIGARNPNGDRWWWANHGDGHGMHVNTNDQRGDHYSMQLWNGKMDTLKVMNDGTVFTNGKINPGSWTDFNYVKVGQGPAWNPGDDVNATGTYIHKDGQIRSRNTTEGDWVHKLYGREHINIHMLHPAGYGMHINTRNADGDKYSLQLHNGQREVFGVYNNGVVNMNNDASRINLFKMNDANRGITIEAGPGGADGVDGGAYNGGLASWYGIGFRCKTDNGVRHMFNTRTGWSGSASWNSWSDAKLKENINDIDASEYDKIDKLRPVTFNMKDDKEKKKQVGFIAQDVEKVYPELVTNGDNNIRTLAYDRLAPMMVGKLQKMGQQVQKDKLCIDNVCITKEELVALKKILRST